MHKPSIQANVHFSVGADIADVFTIIAIQFSVGADIADVFTIIAIQFSVGADIADVFTIVAIQFSVGADIADVFTIVAIQFSVGADIADVFTIVAIQFSKRIPKIKSLIRRKKHKHATRLIFGLIELSLVCKHARTRAHSFAPRFSILIPPATAPGISLLAHHPPPSRLLRQAELLACLEEELPSRMGLLHCAATASALQFPETRLIQYDCGECEAL